MKTLLPRVLKENADYENDPRPKGSAFVIAMPGAGGEMLLDLLYSSALTHVIGNQEPSFYHAITILGESISVNANTYGEPRSVSELEDGFRFYAGRDQDQDERMMHYYIRNTLFRSSGNCIAYTDLLRDEGEGWVSRFAQVIRNINDSSNNHPLRVVFLTNDLGDYPYENPADHCKMLNELKDATELGDIWITRKELLADPLKTMLKIKCSHYPHEDIIKRVMKKYEKSL